MMCFGTLYFVYALKCFQVLKRSKKSRQVINNADITVTKYVAYNLFLMCQNALGIILFAAASVKPIIFLINGQKEVVEGMPTVASAVLTVGPLVLLFYLLINMFIKKALVDKKGQR